MDFNRLGHSGLRVPALGFGTATFGGGNDFFKAWGSTDAAGASRLVDVCLDHGASLFDSADVYSAGLAEQILGEAIKGKLTGKIRRNQPAQPGSRAHDIAGTGPEFEEERLFRIVDALDAVATETGRTIPQVALNWLLRRPTVSTVIIGARNEEQLVQNIGAVGWQLTTDQVAALDAASEVTPAYPVWHQRGFAMLNERAGQ